jgi:hypothetical protein
LVEGDINELAQWFGKRVAVEGIAVSDWGGRWLPIEVEYVASGETEPLRSSRLPRPRFRSELPPQEPTPRPFDTEAERQPWPGDESEEEGLKRLAE